MPTEDYQLIALLVDRGLKAGLHITKSEIIRAGLKALDARINEQPGLGGGDRSVRGLDGGGRVIGDSRLIGCASGQIIGIDRAEQRAFRDDLPAADAWLAAASARVRAR